MSRFSPPGRHAARRAAGVAALDVLDPEDLRLAAARLTERALDLPGEENMTRLGAYPVLVLAERLGLADCAGRAWLTALALLRVRSLMPGGGRHGGGGGGRRLPSGRRRGGRAAGGPGGRGAARPVAAGTGRGDGEPAPAARAGRRRDPGLIDAAVRHGRAASKARHCHAARRGAAPRSAGTGHPPGRRRRTEPGRPGGAGGERLLLRFDAANRDPAVFAEPDRFRADPAGEVLTFGAGPRGCPGSGTRSPWRQAWSTSCATPPAG
ncbi:cytochrome P450 [Micromonospora sp. BRA006-A]|nr:cytochrome P450 [Micromonospora sp. BRA006-A]